MAKQYADDSNESELWTIKLSKLIQTILFKNIFKIL